MSILTKTTSLKHQVEGIELSKDRPYFGLLMEQGTGKTHVALANVVHLYRKQALEVVIVLAPNGVQHNWGINEIPLHVPDDVRAETTVLTWKSGAGVKRMALFDWTIANTNTGLLFVLANIEAVRTDPFIKAIGPLFQRKLMMIVDESTVIKNPKAIQTKRTLALAKYATYKRILTGTPVTQGPLDLWAQCRFLDQMALPYPSYTAFKAEFAIEKDMILGPRHFRKIVGYKNLDRLTNYLRAFTYRVLKDECLDLPPKVYQKRYVDMTEEQERVYKALMKECLVTVNNSMVTVTTVLTMLLRLHTVALGYVTADDKSFQSIPSNRIRSLLELYEELQGKAIIFCRFKEDVRQVVEALKLAGRYPVEYHGDVDEVTRSANVALFQDGNATDFVATRAAARGLTLHAASTVIYYSQGFSLDDRLQSEDRAHRIGQTKSVLYVDFVCRATVDERVIDSLRNKKSLADSIVDPKDFLAVVQAPVEEL